MLVGLYIHNIYVAVTSWMVEFFEVCDIEEGVQATIIRLDILARLGNTGYMLAMLG